MIDVSGTRIRWRALGAFAICATAVIGCGGGPSRTCDQSGGVELCLIEDGPSYNLTGKGLQPESEVRLSVEDDVQPPEPAAQDITARTGADGTLPGAGGKLMALKGPEPQRLLARVTASDGSAVELRFTIPAETG